MSRRIEKILESVDGAISAVLHYDPTRNIYSATYQFNPKANHESAIETLTEKVKSIGWRAFAQKFLEPGKYQVNVKKMPQNA